MNFADTAIDGHSYLDETTYNMFLHLLEGQTAGVPQHVWDLDLADLKREVDQLFEEDAPRNGKRAPAR